jgi:hypothetical protein
MIRKTIGFLVGLTGGSFESLVPPTPMPESDASFDTDHKCSSFWNTF